MTQKPNDFNGVFITWYKPRWLQPKQVIPNRKHEETNPYRSTRECMQAADELSITFALNKKKGSWPLFLIFNFHIKKGRILIKEEGIRVRFDGVEGDRIDIRPEIQGGPYSSLHFSVFDIIIQKFHLTHTHSSLGHSLSLFLSFTVFSLPHITPSSCSVAEAAALQPCCRERQTDQKFKNCKKKKTHPIFNFYFQYTILYQTKSFELLI